MKKFLKVSLALAISLIFSLSLVACGQPKTTPEESAKIILDVVIKDDKTNIDKVGITEKEYTNIRESFENGILTGITSSGLDKSILTDEVKNKFKNDILTGLKKVDYEVKKISEDKTSAKVEVKIKSFDMDKISKDAQEKLMKEVEGNKSMTETQIYQESFKIVGEEMANGTFTEQPKTVTLTFTNENGTWTPKESELVDLIDQV